jgi:TolB-like protein/Flp pilus assembly protein TadD
LIYSFEKYSLDADRQELQRGSELIAVEPQVFDLLHYLICNRERVVTKDDLIANVWRGRIVSDSTLTSRVTAARQAIGDSGQDQRLIRTVARKGLRFVGEVRESKTSAKLSAEVAQVAGKLDAVVASAPAASALLVPDKPSIAVMPFANMSSDPAQEYFSDGITEDIISSLSRLRWFFIIARNSTFSYKGQAADVRQIGHELGVRYLLRGSVRKSGQRVRIACQLVAAISGNLIWTERYDRDLTDIFMLQDEITASITAAIEPKLLAAEATRAERRPIEDLDAWDFVARAVSHFWRLSASESDMAIKILHQAVERHPNYAPAHSTMAFVLLVSAHMGWITVEGNRAPALRLAHRAADLDYNDPWAHMSLGYLAFTNRETDEALRHFRTALDLNPNFAAAHGYLGLALQHDGRSGEAIAYLNQAIRMSPRDPLNAVFLGGIAGAHYFAGRYRDAVKWARLAVESRHSIWAGHRMLCASLAQAGQIDEAKLALAQLRQLQPNFSIAWIRQSIPWTAGPMEKALEGLRKAGLTD